jgi:hypothetical protein
MDENAKYAGMTVNERLFAAGILNDWDAAATSRNRERMIELLGRVELADQAEQIVNTVLANPGLYGF